MSVSARAAHDTGLTLRALVFFVLFDVHADPIAAISPLNNPRDLPATSNCFLDDSIFLLSPTLPHAGATDYL